MESQQMHRNRKLESCHDLNLAEDKRKAWVSVVNVRFPFASRCCILLKINGLKDFWLYQVLTSYESLRVRILLQRLEDRLSRLLLQFTW